MPLDEPRWWYGDRPSLMPRLLAPAAQIVAWLAARRLSRTAGYRSRLPVICVGNFTAGGTGKTPLSLHLARRLQELGERPAFLSRGYGGRERGPHWIAGGDRAADVGDEPLLLTRVAPTLIARDRRAGAIAIETDARNASVILMDDGLQNPQLVKDLSFAIVDATRGLGNGLVLPAGPLRASLEVQLPLADVIVVNEPAGGSGGKTMREADDGVWQHLRASFPGPVLPMTARPAESASTLAGRRLVAFAGIANPDRFFRSINDCGGNVVLTRAFRDHHSFTDAEASALLAEARRRDAALVTTEKDLVRLAGSSGAHAELARETLTLPLEVAFDDQSTTRLNDLLLAAMQTGGYRAGLNRD